MDMLKVLNEEMLLSGTNKKVDFYQRKDLWTISLPKHEKDYYSTKFATQEPLSTFQAHIFDIQLGRGCT